MCAFCSPKLDQVSANKIIEESIRREERTIKPATEFSVHNTHKSEVTPLRARASTLLLLSNFMTPTLSAAVSCVPDKPNYVVPSDQPTDAQLQAAHDKLAMLANNKHAEQLPAQIYSLPATSNMDYGFWAGPATVSLGQSS